MIFNLSYHSLLKPLCFTIPLPWIISLSPLKGVAPTLETREKGGKMVFSSDTAGVSSVTQEGKWIWAYPHEPAPSNRFTYFRKVVSLDAIPAEATLHFAADSNARIWVNGHLFRRKVARYQEEKITCEVLNVGPWLKLGQNVILVLHHNWGDITTFQRTGNQHAGLFVAGSWLNSDATWKCCQAPQFEPHECQVIGIAGEAPRIRYPQILDARKEIQGDLLSAAFDDAQWASAYMVTDGPWPVHPLDVETPGQRETPVFPEAVLAAGTLVPSSQAGEGPYSIAAAIRLAKCIPDAVLTQQAAGLANQASFTLQGKAGESYYVTFDFHCPVHGYPFLEMNSRSAGVVVDFGYGEITRALFDNKVHVTSDGWVNTEGVVGKGYADRVITRAGAQSLELPDERTARWLTLHIHFPMDGEITFHKAGIVKSQYPIQPVGSFECGDERINQIIRLCLVHSEITMIDAYVDTPGREDGQWLEDDRPRAQIAERWYGDFLLRRFLIRTVAESQGPDGHVHAFPPSNYPCYPAAYDWSLQWAAAIYDDYMWTGDVEFLKQYWGNLCSYWDAILSHVNEEGLFLANHLLCDIRVGVTPASNEESSGMITPWVIERLVWSVQLAEAVGDTERAAKWGSIMKKMTAAFRKYHLIPASGGVPLHVDDVYAPGNPVAQRGFSQASHTISVTSHLLTPEESLVILDYVFPGPDGTPPDGVTRWNNPTYCQRALQALTENGFGERAVAHLLERYAPYLPCHPRNKTPLVLQGPLGGPLPEYWINREDGNLKDDEIDRAQPDDETGSHGWGCVPLLWMHDSLLGIRVTQPGGGRICIAPNAAGLPYVSGHSMTPKGLVSVYWDPSSLILEVTIPAVVTAEVVFPAGTSPDRISCPEAAKSLGGGRFEVNTAGHFRWFAY